jgi:hypothetical protein
MLRIKRLLVGLSILVLVSLACNLPNSGGNNPTEAPVGESQQVQPQAEQGQPQQPAGEAPQAQVIVVTATPAPTEIPWAPIGLWEGLSSLNSYRLTIRTVNDGPTAIDKSTTTYFIEMGSDGDSSHTHTDSFERFEDDPQGDYDVSDQYQIGNFTCEYSEGDYEADKTEEDPMAQEITDQWFKLIDVLPKVNDPIFVGSEMLNGVMTNHFTFTLEGLGSESGAEVVRKDGEYWLAQDGQYVVKYSVFMETRNGPVGDPNTQVLHTEFFIEVTDINQEIVITLPAICQ